MRMSAESEVVSWNESDETSLQNCQYKQKKKNNKKEIIIFMIFVSAQ